jgi:sulfite oxidase
MARLLRSAAATFSIFSVAKIYCDAPKKIQMEEVAKHNTAQSAWVAFGDGVYDVTSFAKNHPGGNRILQAAGKHLEAFWEVYPIHHSPQTYAILESLRIGDLDLDSDIETVAVDDPFSGDPERSPLLIVRNDRPFNAETPSDLLKTAITPTELFYVRNHFPVPHLNENHVLTIHTKDGKTKVTLADLLHLPQTSVLATLQCAGNRRSHMSAEKQTQGLQWDVGAIGTARWTGVRLRDVLSLIGFQQESDIHHVQFLGEDGYGSSIPIDKAMSSTGDVIIAHQMNGEPLTMDHGYPLRVLVPGHVAARSVKWLSEIKLSQEESLAVWQRKDYKVVPPDTDPSLLATAMDDALSIQETPVQSAILSPSHGDLISGEKVHVSGYAYSGGGRGIARVDVSTDGGKTWKYAKLLNDDYQGSGRKWDWTLWEIVLPFESEKAEIVCKAIDSAYNVQPEYQSQIYNLRGVLPTGWHRINIHRKE